MDIEAISGAGIVALACAILFMLVAKSWNVLSRAAGAAPNFSDSIMHEAAQRFRDDFERISISQSIYLGALLVFSMLFAAAYLLDAGRLFVGYPDWQLHLQLIFVSLAAVFAIGELVATFLAGRRLRFRKDANIAVGHRLQQICSESTLVFHDVATAAGVIDHVVIAKTGLYAVNVVARRARHNAEVRLADNVLEFSGTTRERCIDDLVAKVKSLEQEFQQLLGYKVRVRSVVAVPGWTVTAQTTARHLLVDEKTVAILTGWKDNAEQLMQDDVERLQSEMKARCMHAIARLSD